MFERFTDRARRVIVLAQEEAALLNHDHIGTEHLLLGLARSDDRTVADTLAHWDIDRSALRAAVADAVRRAG